MQVTFGAEPGAGQHGTIAIPEQPKLGYHGREGGDVSPVGEEFSVKLESFCESVSSIGEAVEDTAEDSVGVRSAILAEFDLWALNSAVECHLHTLPIGGFPRT